MQGLDERRRRDSLGRSAPSAAADASGHTRRLAESRTKTRSAGIALGQLSSTLNLEQSKAKKSAHAQPSDANPGVLHPHTRPYAWWMQHTGEKLHIRSEGN